MTDPQHRPTGETSIMIVPPRDICGFADHYRRLYMPDTMHRVEPHITVTIPFVPYGQLEQAEPRLRQALTHCPPTRLSIRGFGMFRDTGILYLWTAYPERVLSIYKAILAEFPDYPAYGGKYGDDFTPHMAVGRFSDPDELESVYNELSGMRLYLGWDVDRVIVKYKTEETLWLTWGAFPLKGRTW